MIPTYSTFIPSTPLITFPHHLAPLTKSRRLPTRNPTVRTNHSATTCQLTPPPNNDDSTTFPQLQADILAYIDTLPPPSEPTNPLTYINLGKNGRTDLISRIMQHGGYIAVSNRLDIPVDQTDFIPPPPVAIPSKFDRQDDGASLALGRNLEARLEAVESVLQQSNPHPARIFQPAPLRQGDDVPSAEELLQRNAQIVPPVIDDPVPEGERLKLTANMRLGMLAWVVAIAIGYGRTSHGLLADSVVNVCRSLAAVLGMAHIIVGVYGGGVLAPKLGRNGRLWFLKGVLGGPLGLGHLRKLGPL